MKEFLVESNAFTGQIPSELGQWMNLTKMNLSDNDLQGSIPLEFSSLPLMTTIELFNISNNPHLTGTVPESFCNTSEDLVILYDCTDRLCGCECPCANETNGTDHAILP